MRALVVYKKSDYELYAHEPPDDRFIALQASDHPFIQAMQLSDTENRHTLAVVCAAFEAVGLPYDCLYRGELQEVTGYDLLCSVGGDGTFLEVARYAVDIPVLGVNSDPARSTALFCAAGRSTIQSCLEALLAGRLHEVSLARLRVTINGEPLPSYALNDLLFAHANPAATTSYTLRLGETSELQKSSGLWIATAAGSTAAIRASGGEIMPLHSRELQYLTREPYVADGCSYQLLKGLVGQDTPLEVTSKTRRGYVFMDGPHRQFPLGLGDVMTVTTAAPPLRVLGLDRIRRQRF